MADHYAAALVRFRWFVVFGWLTIAGGLAVALPTLSQTGGSGGFRGLATTDNPAVQAEIRSFEKFGFPVLTRTAVVQRNPEGLSPAAQLRAVTSAIRFNLNRPPELERIEFAVPIVNSLGVFASREEGTTAITYLYFRPTVGFGRQTGLADAYADRYLSRPDDHRVGETGVIPARIAQVVILREHLRTVELVTVGLIVVVVAANFLALGAPLMTMVTAGLALSIVVRLSGWIGERAGFDVPSEIEPLIVALLLGIVTDYSIFFLSGTRERLGRGEHRLDAARHSAAEFGPIVVVAGLTVAAGSLALLVASVGTFRVFGPGMALTILISLAVAVTFVPAGLAILGNAVFWPRRPGRDHGGGGRSAMRSRLVGIITRRRVAVAVVVVVGGALVVAAAPVTKLELGFPVIESLPESYEAAEAADAAAQGFSPGVLSPTVVLLEGERLGDQRGGLDRLQALLANQPGVAGVAGPANLPTALTVGAVVAPSGDAARYIVVFGEDPLGARAINDLQRIRADMPALLAEAGVSGATVSFAGDTALAATTVTRTEADLALVILVATGLGFLLVAVFLRAIVAPLYLTAVNLLAVVATLGLTTFVFQTLAGQSGLTFYVPFAAAVLLVALGSDYSIFGIGYIWAEARRRPLLDAVRVAVPRSTRAISAAGITLAVSFAALAVVPLSPFREFAFAMFVGILIDVFVVRSLLVPSMVVLAGSASAWPGRALRMVESEPEALPRRASAQCLPARGPATRALLAGAAIAYGISWLRRRRRHRRRRRSKRS